MYFTTLNSIAPNWLGKANDKVDITLTANYSDIIGLLTDTHKQAIYGRLKFRVSCFNGIDLCVVVFLIIIIIITAKAPLSALIEKRSDTDDFTSSRGVRRPAAVLCRLYRPEQKESTCCSSERELLQTGEDCR